MLKRRFRNVISRPQRIFLKSHITFFRAPFKAKRKALFNLGLVSKNAKWLPARQLEAILRKSLRRVVKKRGFVENTSLSLFSSYCKTV